ncbi:MAG TPA: colicin transporter [Allosphingosinicella sp.]
MIARGFKSVIWVATVGSAALGCYMVSLRVATERNELAKVERQIIAAKRDIRSLQTELGTRGRMTQLEQWNAEVLALSAPSSAQFLEDEFTLARLYRNDPTVADRSAEVRLASAETPDAKPAETAKPAPPPVVQAVAEPAAAQPPMIHRASFTTAEPPAAPKPVVARPDKPAAQRSAAATPAKPDTAPALPGAKSAKPAGQRSASAAPAKPEAAPVRPAAKPAAKPVTAAAKPVREAAAAPRDAKVKGSGGR